MPRNSQAFVYVQVPFPKNSSVLEHLKKEAKRYKNSKKTPPIGPHIAELLEDRDAHIYETAEGDGKGIWFPPRYLAQNVVQVTHPPAHTDDDSLEVITADEIATVQDNASAFVSSLDDDDDD